MICYEYVEAFTMIENKNLRIAIYIRVSTLYQVDKDSLPMQREDLTNYCKYIFNTEDYEIFEDAGYSGKNTGRPAFQEMMIKIRKKEFTHILVWKIDRISRNLLDFSNMYEELKKYGVTFVSKNEQFDTSSAMGEAMLKIILVFAELERKLTSERVSATMISRATKGLWNGANVPIGYKWDPDTKFPIPDPNEAKTVQLIYDMYIKAKSCLALAKHLNTENIPTKRGGKWTSKTVNDILRNPFYKGTYRYNYRESARGRKKNENEWIIIDDNHEGIIDKTVWQLANDILDSNAGLLKTKYRKYKHIHIFSKKLTCTKCSNGYIATKDKARNDGYMPSKYRCAGKMHKHICDAKLVSDVVLGPFILTLIKNIINAGNMYIDTIQELEDILLTGDPFKDVLSINKEDLEILYIALFHVPATTKNITYKSTLESLPKDNEEMERDFLKKKLEKFKKDKMKYSKALERLEDLYLFSEESMSKVDYLLKKKQYESKLDEIEQNLKQFYRMNDKTRNIKDMTFVLNYEEFLFNQMLGKKELNFKHLMTNTNNNVIKDLIDTIIKTIYMHDKTVVSVEFNNGIHLHFNY
jgi:putative resolvase